MKLPALATFLLLAACGGQAPADNMSDRLDAAADQSTPQAADVLENAADRVEEAQGGEVNQIANQALEDAANAQAPGGGR